MAIEKCIHKVVVIPVTNPRFPIDMLRHDGLVPFSKSDSNMIALSHAAAGEPMDLSEGGGNREITLSKMEHKFWKPDAERWLKSGWKIISHSYSR
jgi:hypothetical protein